MFRLVLRFCFSSVLRWAKISLAQFSGRTLCYLVPGLNSLFLPQVVRDSDLFGMLGGLVLVDVTLLVTWMVLHPPSRQVIIFEEDAKVSSIRINLATLVSKKMNSLR